MTRLAPLLALCLAPALAAPAVGGDWPQWRGANFDGVSPETGLPSGWGDGADGAVAWRTPLPGPGGGTPVIAGGRVFLTAAAGAGEGAELLAVAYDAATGDELWRRVAAKGNERAMRDEGNSASASCVTDGERVWATFGDGTVACLTADAGEPVWSLNLQERFGRFQLQFGFHSTPALHDGRLYFQLIHGDGDPGTDEARVVALDAATGVTAWERPRVTGATVENEHSYASAVVNVFDSPPSLLTHGGDYAIAHSLEVGEDGAELWRLGGLNPPGETYNTTLRLVASPAVGVGPAGPLVIVPTAKRGPVFAVDPAAARDAGSLSADAAAAADVQGTDAVVWVTDRGTPDVSSPLLHAGVVYLMGERGVLSARDAATGGELYQERLPGGRYRASPVFADGKLYLVARDGTVTVANAGRAFERLSEEAFGEETSASPAVADGTLFFRTFDALYAVRTR